MPVTSWPDVPVGRHDLDRRARRGHPLGTGQRVLGAVVVEERGPSRVRRGRAADDVPRADDQVGAFGQQREPRLPAGRDDDDIGAERRNRGGVGDDPETQVDAGVPAFGREPVDDPDEVGAAGRRPCGEHDLPAGLRRRLEQHHRMSALGGDPRRLEPGRTRADDDDPARRARRSRRQVRDRLLASRRRVLDAQRVEARGTAG